MLASLIAKVTSICASSAGEGILGSVRVACLYADRKEPSLPEGEGPAQGMLRARLSNAASIMIADCENQKS